MSSGAVRRRADANVMPRLTGRKYLFIRKSLAEVWQTRQQAFSLIPSTGQWCLHEYLRPSDETGGR